MTMDSAQGCFGCAFFESFASLFEHCCRLVLPPQRIETVEAKPSGCVPFSAQDVPPSGPSQVERRGTVSGQRCGSHFVDLLGPASASLSCSPGCSLMMNLLVLDAALFYFGGLASH